MFSQSIRVMKMRILIKNGFIVDGTGSEGYYGDVLTDGAIISKVSSCIEACADRVVEASGCIVCPGFIDTHSHSDVQILKNPYIEAKIRQGITTEILGQDGISAAPLPERYIDDWKRNLAGLDGELENIGWDFETVGDYLDKLERNGVCLNAGYLVPHGNIRMEAVGLEDRNASPDEILQMKRILEREMESGALGLSTGLIYTPCTYGSSLELTELCKVVRKYDGVFVVHQRSEADDILNSMDEVINIGKASGVRVHFSHFKVCGKKNWSKIDKVLEKLDEAKADGVQISYDQYPYAAGSTMLAVILPPWVLDGGTRKMLQKLGESDARKRIKADIAAGLKGWDNFVDFAGTDKIFITSVKTERNRNLIGKSLEEIGELTGKDPLDAAMDIIAEEENAVGMIDFYGLEEHVKLFMKRPEQNVCTDGLLGGKPHPRVYGAFPRILGKYVREENLMGIEEAVYKMTYRAASVFGLTGRGCLKEGKAADIVIFNPDIVRDKGTYTEPEQYPDGIGLVMVNGEIVLEDGNLRRVLPGCVIRKDDKKNGV